MRFRPIMMTTMAALMGSLPIALGLGAGGEARRPLGLAVVGGLRRVADADALHHAGDLPVLRAAAHLAGDARRAHSGGTITGGLRRHPIAELSVAARA